MTSVATSIGKQTVVVVVGTALRLDSNPLRCQGNDADDDTERAQGAKHSPSVTAGRRRAVEVVGPRHIADLFGRSRNTLVNPLGPGTRGG
jgi:hypothetical protein